MIAADVMTPLPITADAGASVRAVMQQLFELDVRHIPIMDDGQLVGIVSDRDLRDVTNRLVSGGVPDASLLGARIADVMSTEVLSVHPEAELQEVAALMVEHKVGAILVVTPGTGELLGIVSYVDILRAACDLL